jgi:tetratricopeptide (TPR) repeat protein
MAISFQKILFVLLLAFSELAFAQTTKQDIQAGEKSLMQKGNELMRIRKFDEAVEVFQQAVAAQPAAIEPRVMLGTAMINSGHPIEAIEEIKRAIQLDSTSAPAYLVMGNANLTMRRYNEAIEAFAQSVRINPDYLPAYLNLGIAYSETKHFEESVEANKQALRISPNHPSALNAIGIGYYRLGQHQLGIELGRHEESVEAQAQVIRLAPRFPNAYRLSAISNFILGRSEAVIKDATRGLELTDWRGTNSQFVIIFLALSQRRMGLEDEAKTTLSLASKRSDPKLWPYAIIRYLNNEIDANALIQTSNDNEKLTESHAYIGINLQLNKKPDEAREHFEWIKANGTKRFIEYTIAEKELQKVETLKQK